MENFEVIQNLFAEVLRKVGDKDDFGNYAITIFSGKHSAHITYKVSKNLFNNTIWYEYITDCETHSRESGSLTGFDDEMFQLLAKNITKELVNYKHKLVGWLEYADTLMQQVVDLCYVRKYQ